MEFCRITRRAYLAPAKGTVFYSFIHSETMTVQHDKPSICTEGMPSSFHFCKSGY